MLFEPPMMPRPSAPTPRTIRTFCAQSAYSTATLERVRLARNRK